MKLKYAVLPGYVTSRSDGERHFISFWKLCELHRVNPRECVDTSRPECMQGRDLSKLKRLCVSPSGNYPATVPAT